MGFSFVSESILRAHLPESNWRMLIAKLGYGIGFLIVILGRQQLFTENTLTVILPLLRRRRADVLRNVARLWLVVLTANLVGAFVFAAAIGRTPALSPESTPASARSPPRRSRSRSGPCSSAASSRAG